MGIQTTYINNLATLLQIISDVTDQFFWNPTNEKPNIIWFRGQSNHEYHLLPSLYRPILFKLFPKSDLEKKEKLLLEYFSTKNYHRFPHKLENNNLLWMSIMQHYGVPTRLLDWSETIFTALFFALENYYLNPHPSTTDIPCIWVLNPQILNEQFSSIYSSGDISEKINSRNIPSIMYLDEKGLINVQSPLAVISPYNNERIYHQSGAFILYPSIIGDINASGIDQYTDSDKFLRKYVITQPQTMKSELKQIGIRRSMFYPEMENTSPEIADYILYS